MKLTLEVKLVLEEKHFSSTKIFYENYQHFTKFNEFNWCFFVDGKWSSWTSWTSCSVDCGGGEKTRVRYCSNPRPCFGGRFCEGYNSEEATCNEQPCSYGEFSV